MFLLPLTKWQAVSKVVNKLSKTKALLCLFGSQLCKNLEVPGFTESVAQTSLRFVLQTPLTCHHEVVLLLPCYCWTQVCELLCRFRGSSLLFYAVPLCVPALPELGYTTPALDLKPEAEASNAGFTTSGETC